MQKLMCPKINNSQWSRQEVLLRICICMHRSHLCQYQRQRPRYKESRELILARPQSTVSVSLVHQDMMSRTIWAESGPERVSLGQTPLRLAIAVSPSTMTNKVLLSLDFEYR